MTASPTDTTDPVDADDLTDEDLAALVDISDEFNAARRAGIAADDESVETVGDTELEWNVARIAGHLRQLVLDLDEVIYELRTDALVSVTQLSAPITTTHDGAALTCVGWAWYRSGRCRPVVYSDDAPTPWILEPAVGMKAQRRDV